MIRKHFCWLFGHSFICLFEYHFENTGNMGSDYTGWVCQHCGKIRTEQWDSSIRLYNGSE